MKVENMTSAQGNKVANQFIIYHKTLGEGQVMPDEVWFQSYDTIIVKQVYGKNPRIYLDRTKWDYSKTTGKYRNLFLGETKAETQKKIDSGEYILTDLN